MDASYKLSRTMVFVLLLMILTGVAAVVAGFITDPARTWPNILINNMYFLTISMGALLFYSIQYITGSSWSALFQRVPLALGSFIPAAAIGMLLLYFGLPDIYKWALPGITETDKLIAHKEPFLNVPFYMIRIVVYFALWIPLFLALRRLARKEDLQPGIAFYKKSSYIAKVFIFTAVLFFSMAAIDWIMTIDSHWYSTLFGFRAMVTSMYYGVASIIILVFFLKKLGFFPRLNTAHQHDLARYLFRFSIVFGYLWFMQFLILWYANIPELTVYYQPRFIGAWKYLFYAELFMNFAIPFVVLMADDIGKRKPVLMGMSILLLAGLWISLFLQVMPGSYGKLAFGFIEAGMWLGYAGLFLLLTFYALSRMSIVPLNHPQLNESIHHHL
jgi:hypothetical protein